MDKKKLKGSNLKMLNDQWQCTDYRKQDLLRAAPVVGTTSYADQMVSAVSSCEKNTTFMKHGNHTKLEEEINNGMPSNY